MQFRPCIDIHDGKVKQIIGSTLTNNFSVTENFVADKDASYFANLYKKDGLSGGHIIMLDKKEKTKKQALFALESFPDGLQIGGEINLDNAKKFISDGASRVIVTSYIFENGKLDFGKLQTLVDTIGKNRLILDLSCRKKDGKYYIVIDRWQTFTNLEVNLDTLNMLAKYCDEFLIHGVDVEGRKQGIEEELLKILKNFTKIPITYAGGIKDVGDIEKIKKIGNKKINFTVGSALDIFGGNLSYKKICKIFK
ncbi:MAG: phosphoribosylformimino-5-aminoimidazole carboxamide ribotide isomerase [Candidatus Magasanikbacteria bacterium]|jgi:phosphoribosylformimino-5-aminoimidazole carboxamide ribotide isomerase|nr:phosphoribosylformimino-5-aminoimidazole carboxamide ribotide isomerase [Candidatus Magasanikbacteria bacterium]MBT4314867.1 phosphoribosylformimino-5-aminoimidazole carboxamide ribotide isomerase [Candidatus Magasanikbacteria bacterium]MBT4546746.1 phosphoribosylformimino-5-aminoimidazole carboxamide ribotide isomerase [Candidatus Magasanikbacteria bacterium]MBT6819645.1 phosphoribosylformimino-5-aminoimidazole carboxamide ribotide isomerase [Candidatus Magasanikbacteria bacterium]